MKYLALCLFCRNEGPYLQEWCDYHFRLGVETIILIDNRSDPPLAGFVEQYGKRVITRFNSDEGPEKQCRAYARCIAEFQEMFHWIGFIDTDEFLVPANGKSLAEFLEGYERFGGIGVFWYCFGSNGHQRRQPSVIEGFTRRSRDSFHYNDHIKSIVRTAAVRPVPTGTPHHFNYEGGQCCVDEFGEPISGPRRRRTSKTIQLNHYILRSREEFQAKTLRGGGNGVIRRDMRFFEGFDAECNEVEDRRILDAIASLDTTGLDGNPYPL